jgi:cytochrome P450
LSLLQRPEVFEKVYNEVAQLANVDKSSGKVRIDIPTLMSQPWLLAVYTETLRLRVHFNVTCEITQDIEIDGHVLKAGHIVMAPTYIAHTLDPSWTTEKYPVWEFCAERFLIFDEKASAPKFSVGEAGGKMFPYGGGIFLCPGRNFAKQEIMAAIAFMLLSFDFEVLGYVKMDGGKSDRGPRLDEQFAGAGVTPPDRDIRVRLRKRGWS